MSVSQCYMIFSVVSFQFSVFKGHWPSGMSFPKIRTLCVCVGACVCVCGCVCVCKSMVMIE